MQLGIFHKHLYRSLLLTLLLLLPSSVLNAADVTLAWDANTEEDLAGYKLHYGVISGTYTEVENVGNVTQYTQTGMAENTYYYFALTAYTEDNESDYSNEVRWRSDEGPIAKPFPAKSATFILAELESAEIIIDDGDPGTSFTGKWIKSGAPNPYGAQSIFSDTSTPESPHLYEFKGAVTGEVDLDMWWTVYGVLSRCELVNIDIFDGDTLLRNTAVNHQHNGGQWNRIGTYNFTGEARVVIKAEAAFPNPEDDNPDEMCSTSADAVRFSKAR